MIKKIMDWAVGVFKKMAINIKYIFTNKISNTGLFITFLFCFGLINLEIKLHHLGICVRNENLSAKLWKINEFMTKVSVWNRGVATTNLINLEPYLELMNIKLEEGVDLLINSIANKPTIGLNRVYISKDDLSLWREIKKNNINLMLNPNTDKIPKEILNIVDKPNEYKSLLNLRHYSILFCGILILSDISLKHVFI